MKSLLSKAFPKRWRAAVLVLILLGIPTTGNEKWQNKDGIRDRPRLQTVKAGLPEHRIRRRRAAPDEILVKFRESVDESSARATLEAYRVRKIERISQLGVYHVQIPSQAGLEETISALVRNPDVTYAGKNPRIHLTASPNDEYFWRQYALYNSGGQVEVPGSPQGKARADIKATAAWEETKGDGGVIIAVLDTGLDMDHPDIKNKVVSKGRDFINDDDDAADDHWHGTHVAGIAAAETNNNRGIAGVAWNCRILPVKIIDKDGYGYGSELIKGITWAVDNKANVINLSLGTEDDDPTIKAAVKYAYDKGVVVVASAGNDGSSVLYPAAYDQFCLAVAATDYLDNVTEWSNRGREIDVAAPGEMILSLMPTWYNGPNHPPYAFASGTSMAAPHVAGFAALLKSFKPWLSVADIMNVIRFSADDVNSAQKKGRDNDIGYGRINMEKALVPLKIKS
ncbi:MAG: S8 family peptidase [Acidobacteriota bacterium]|nr:S8 family peptidase [Acidobacteriota bacterium]